MPVTTPRYTGIFSFSCLPSFAAPAAKNEMPFVNAPYVLTKRDTPLKKCVYGEFLSLVLVEKEFDQEGGENGVGGIDAYYFGRRFYDPEIGMWTSPDPAQQYWSTYNYAGGNPINNVDPNGAYEYPVLTYQGTPNNFGQARISLSTGLPYNHLGTDIPCTIGTPVIAVGEGKVVAAYFSTTYGNTVIIDHGNGNYSLVAHLDQIEVSPGQLVMEGMEVGLSGNSGESRGPHVHFEEASLVPGQNAADVFSELMGWGFTGTDRNDFQYGERLEPGTVNFGYVSNLAPAISVIIVTKPLVVKPSTNGFIGSNGGCTSCDNDQIIEGVDINSTTDESDDGTALAKKRKQIR